jgi:hypothetical protein
VLSLINHDNLRFSEFFDTPKLAHTFDIVNYLLSFFQKMSGSGFNECLNGLIQRRYECENDVCHHEDPPPA